MSPVISDFEKRFVVDTLKSYYARLVQPTQDPKLLDDMRKAVAFLATRNTTAAETVQGWCQLLASNQNNRAVVAEKVKEYLVYWER